MIKFAALLCSVALAAALPLTAAGQADSPAAAEADQAAIVAAARRLVAERYVIPETAQRLDAAIADAAARGEFDGLRGAALSDRLNTVMKAVTPDGHLYATYNPGQSAAIAAAGTPDDADSELPADYLRQIDRDNAGILRLEVLPGNVRYIEIRQFMWGTPAAEASIAAAMEFLRGGDAMVIDIRNCGGGSPDAVAAITGYFLPAGTPLARFEMRGRPGETNEAHAAPFSLAGKPLYVLTSPRSFSAAEEFAQHVSAFKFGELVGTATGGGGFRNDLYALPGGYVLSVSVGRPVHAVTGGDWERVGVPSTIAVAEDKALLRAQAEALTRVASETSGPERAAAQRLAAFYRAVESTPAPALPLERYAGTYGDRIVSVADGRLVMQRGSRPQTRLVPLGDNLFAPETSPAQRFAFVAQGDAVAAMEIDNGDGAPNRVPRS